MAARIATEQIIDLRTTLRYLGVPIKGRAFMFGDNQSVITSSMIPHSRLSKRHNALSYHWVREAIVAEILSFHQIEGKKNPADILSKHCGRPQMVDHVNPLLFQIDKFSAELSFLSCSRSADVLDTMRSQWDSTE